MLRFEALRFTTVLACVAGRRKGGRKAILPRFARSSFPFPSPSDACTTVPYSAAITVNIIEKTWLSSVFRRIVHSERSGATSAVEMTENSRI